MTLGRRLKAIEAMVGSGYSHIWDCCCDHGLLGAALITRRAAPHIHFVDIVPSLIANLEQQLNRFFPDNSPAGDMETATSQWHLHCANLIDLPLESFGGKHLLIIAGVGGDLSTDFIAALSERHPKLDLDFILCPIHHQFKLRQELIARRFHLRQEILIEENKRFYEILWVSSNPEGTVPESPVSPVGDSLWRGENPAHEKLVLQYLRTKLNHYQRIQSRQGNEISQIINAYHNVYKTLKPST